MESPDFIDDDAYASSKRSEGLQLKLAALLALAELVTLRAVQVLEEKHHCLVLPTSTVPVAPSQSPGTMGVDRRYAGAVGMQLEAAMMKSREERGEALDAADTSLLGTLKTSHADIFEGGGTRPIIPMLHTVATDSTGSIVVTVTDKAVVHAAQLVTDHSMAAQRLLQLRGCTVPMEALLSAATNFDVLHTIANMPSTGERVVAPVQLHRTQNYIRSHLCRPTRGNSGRHVGSGQEPTGNDIEREDCPSASSTAFALSARACAGASQSLYTCQCACGARDVRGCCCSGRKRWRRGLDATCQHQRSDPPCWCCPPCPIR